MNTLFPEATPGMGFLGGLLIGIQRRLPRALSGDTFALSGTRRIDAPLAVGALLFGIGWGIAGLCPGPAIANLALVPFAVLPFLTAMIAGMLLHRLWVAGR